MCLYVFKQDCIASIGNLGIQGFAATQAPCLGFLLAEDKPETAHMFLPHISVIYRIKDLEWNREFPEVCNICSSNNMSICGCVILAEGDAPIGADYQFSDDNLKFIEWGLGEHPQFFVMALNQESCYKFFSGGGGKLKEAPVFVHQRGARRTTMLRFEGAADEVTELRNLINSFTGSATASSEGQAISESENEEEKEDIPTSRRIRRLHRKISPPLNKASSSSSMPTRRLRTKTAPSCTGGTFASSGGTSTSSGLHASDAYASDAMGRSSGGTSTSLGLSASDVKRRKLEFSCDPLIKCKEMFLRKQRQNLPCTVRSMRSLFANCSCRGFTYEWVQQHFVVSGEGLIIGEVLAGEDLADEDGTKKEMIVVPERPLTMADLGSIMEQSSVITQLVTSLLLKGRSMEDIEVEVRKAVQETIIDLEP